MSNTKTSYQPYTMSANIKVGPLGEGKIIYVCITCPWHDYQYLPNNGQSPPPHTEKVAPYNLKLVGRTIFIDPNAHAKGTEVNLYS